MYPMHAYIWFGRETCCSSSSSSHQKNAVTECDTQHSISFRFVYQDHSIGWTTFSFFNLERIKVFDCLAGLIHASNTSYEVDYKQWKLETPSVICTA